MGYLHIENAYRTPEIWHFKALYALEKIHGTSAHIAWSANGLRFFAGGEKQETFVALFDVEKLAQEFLALGHTSVTVYGEAYGGRCQGMKDTYGDKLKFVVFDVKVGETWLSVPNAENVAHKLGLEFVHYDLILATPEAADGARDQPSMQAKRNGIEGDKPSEGVVLRPLSEFIKSNGQRVISKHKRAEFRETSTTRKVVDLDQLKVLESADAIALEWVTEQRLEHVIDKVAAGSPVGMEILGEVIRFMIQDVKREAGVPEDDTLVVKGQEIIWSKDAEKKVGRRTAELFKKRMGRASDVRS